MDDLFSPESGIVFDNTRLSFIGRDCYKIPKIIPIRYGSKVDILDLSSNSLTTLQIINLELFLHKVKESLPSLKYLSLLGNKACPNQLSDMNKDEEDYRRYRYYVINQLPNLQFLDSTCVSTEEKQEAQMRGHLMKVAKPQKASFPIKHEDNYISSPNQYTPLPKTRRAIDDHQGIYGKCFYKYSGKHSEGNRFIQNHDL
ncbi:hypothetical protein RUM44_002664 [Polyplax serrata]|uniref:Leucine-rich melanocyte differentiation-associated protein-like n=1 Tax=Polyplax serrata TaxID=468196 RepID=A0ABR1AGQ6_POLSC